MKNIKKLFITSLVLLTVINFILAQIFPIYGAEKILPSGIKYSDLPKEIENYVAEHQETVCGMNVIVYDRGGTLYKNSFGYMDKERKIRSDEDTVYEWGSISKLLVWVSVMQFYEEGKLDLNRDIKNYLPEGFLKNLSFDIPITMTDLMNHQAGFQDTYFIQTADPSQIVSLEETLRLRQPKQVYQPGEHTAYSNWSAALAALIVEKVSGTDYVDYVHKNIFEPLNMNHTSISPTYRDNDYVLAKRLQLKCYDISGEIIDGPGLYYIYVYPAGSAAGTIGDLKKFAQAVTLSGDKPSPLFKRQSTLNEIYTPTSFYGSTNVAKNYHGFFASEYGVETVGHGGNTFGCSSMLQFDPVSGVGMVVMTNQAHESVFNYDMYETVFGKFKDSKLNEIEREVPKGLILNTRGIKKGPLSFVGALGVTSFGEEDLDNWWYEEDGILETQFSDFIASWPKALINIMCMAVFVIAGVYGILKLLIGGLIIDTIIKKKACTTIDKYLNTVYGFMGLAFINLLVIFVRLSGGYRTGEIGSVESYMAQSGIFLILLIIMAIFVFRGIKNYNNVSEKKEKRELFISLLLAISQCLIMINFEMYKFWEIV